MVMRTLTCLCYLFVLQAVAQQQPEGFDPPVRPEPIERFRGPVTVRTAAGANRTVNVAIRTWGIQNRQRITLPETGFRVVQLISGDLTTVIAGQRQQRKEGDFWTVPAGQDLVVETARDTVMLSVVSIAP